jgi:hypothetical protein
VFVKIKVTQVKDRVDMGNFVEALDGCYTLNLRICVHSKVC